MGLFHGCVKVRPAAARALLLYAIAPLPGAAGKAAAGRNFAVFGGSFFAKTNAQPVSDFKAQASSGNAHRKPGTLRGSCAVVKNQRPLKNKMPEALRIVRSGNERVVLQRPPACRNRCLQQKMKLRPLVYLKDNNRPRRLRSGFPLAGIPNPSVGQLRGACPRAKHGAQACRHIPSLSRKKRSPDDRSAAAEHKRLWQLAPRAAVAPHKILRPALRTEVLPPAVVPNFSPRILCVGRDPCCAFMPSER